MASQTNNAGAPLNLRDAYVITGSGLAFSADQYVLSATRNDANGMLNPIAKRQIGTASDSRINTGFLHPVSDIQIAAMPTTWFVAAKNGRFGISVAKLKGSNGMPTMSTTVLNTMGRYGIAIDISYPLAAAASGYQGLVMCQP